MSDNGTTSFQSPGVSTVAANSVADNTIVLELDGRKFTKADLATKIKSADAFIEKLKTERAEDHKLLTEVNETLKKQVDMTELLKSLKANPTAATEPAASATVVAPAVKAEDITKAVLENLAAEKDSVTRKQNFADVSFRLTQAFGNATDQKVAERANEMGMTVEDIVALAETKPKAALALFPELNAKSPRKAIHESSVTSGSFQSPVKAPSGYAAAKNDRERAAIYMKRLNELSSQ